MNDMTLLQARESYFTLTHSPATIWTVDAGDLASFPLAPLDRRGWSRYRGNGPRDDSAMARWPSIGWTVTAHRTNRAITELARSVHLSLLGSVALDGPLDTGPVEFVAYDVLQRLGRLSYSSGHVAPGGSAYNDLRLALEYLKTTEYRGGGFDSPFTILRDYELSGVNAGRSYVLYSEPFMQALRTRPAPIALNTYAELSRGSPRALYGLLAAHRPLKRIEITGRELMSRIGSSHSNVNASRIGQRLGKAHKELLRFGVLTAEPEIRKKDGAWTVSYELSRPKLRWIQRLPMSTLGGVADTIEETEIGIATGIFARLAIEWGVVPEVARSLAIKHPRSLARTVAAAAIGIARPQKSVPAMVVHYTRNPEKAAFNETTFDTPWNWADRLPGFIPNHLRNQRLALGQRSTKINIPRDASEERSVELAILAGAGLDLWVVRGVQAVLHQLMLRLAPVEA